MNKIMNFYEFLETVALQKVLLETSEEDTAIIVKYHPEWNEKIRTLLNQESNDLLDSLLFSVKENNEEIFNIFETKHKEKLKEEYEKNADLF